MTRYKPRPDAVTLVELILVLFILVAVAGVVLPGVVTTRASTQETTTRASLAVIRDATIQYWSDCKYLIAAREAADPTFSGVRIDDLLNNPFGASGEFNPETGLGWRGPYISNAVGVPVDDPDDPSGDLPDAFRLDVNFDRYFRGATSPVSAVLDDWGTPIIIQDVTAFRLASNDSPVLGEQRLLRVVSAGSGTIGTPGSLAYRNSIRIDHDPTALEVDDEDENDFSLSFIVR